jgi:hypothetical protein
VICGHFAAQYRQVSTNNYGLPVHEILVDYQTGWDNGGNGYLRIMKFKPDQNRIECFSYSPYIDDWNPGGDDEFVLTVNFDDYVATPGQVSRRFQAGVDGYAGTQDTWVGEKHKDTPHGASTRIVVDDDTENGPFWEPDYVGQGLVRFDDIAQGPVHEGDPAPTRIPSDATVQNATITLNLADDTDSWNPDFYVHRMTRDWNEGATWNSLAGGVSPGSDCDSQPFAIFQGDNSPDADFHRTFAAKSVVQDWVSSGTNYGFAILPERGKQLDLAKMSVAEAERQEKLFDDGIEIYSSEDGATALRPALDVEFSYPVHNRPPVIDAGLAANHATRNEGQEVKLTLSASDPNPLDPLTFELNGDPVGYATGSGTLEHWVLLEDEGTYEFEAWVLDDEDSTYAGSVTVVVANVAPQIVDLTEDLSVEEDIAFDFAVVADDPGILDVLTYAWDFDDDGVFDDFAGAVGQWTFAEPGVYPVHVRVSDDDGGVTPGSLTVTVTAACAGDCNCDGLINFQDIPYLKAALGDNEAAWRQRYADDHAGAAPPCSYDSCNADDVGGVNFQDIPALKALLGTSCGTGP